jgi:hypothetical protein
MVFALRSVEALFMQGKAIKQKCKILYVLGAGRSGSTLLDILLGSGAESWSTGELVHLHERGWHNNEFCSCGKRVNECGFWRDVKQRWTRPSAPDGVERFLELQRRFERMRFLFFRARLSRDPEFQEYLRDLNRLLRCVLEASGKRCLVDSSKKPIRAHFLAMLPDFDVYLIHLVRDSRGVAWSKGKAFSKDERRGVQADLGAAPVARTARRWLLTNLVCSYLCLSRRLRRRSLRIRYEDFVADPVSTLREIAGFCEVDLAEPIRKVLGGEDLRPAHAVAGNRMRMSRALRIRADLEWKAKLAPRGESIVWRWTGWLLRHYGYVRELEVACPAPISTTALPRAASGPP